MFKIMKYILKNTLLKIRNIKTITFAIDRQSGQKGLCGKDPVHRGPARVPPAPHPEVHRLLQHQLLLPEHGGPASAPALPGRGRGQAGADAHGDQR